MLMCVCVWVFINVVCFFFLYFFVCVHSAVETSDIHKIIRVDGVHVYGNVESCLQCS